MNSSQLRYGSFSNLVMRLAIEALMSAIRDSIPSVAASSIFCSLSAAAPWVELLAVADEVLDAAAAPGFGGRFIPLFVEIGDPQSLHGHTHASRHKLTNHHHSSTSNSPFQIPTLNYTSSSIASLALALLFGFDRCSCSCAVDAT